MGVRVTSRRARSLTERNKKGRREKQATHCPAESRGGRGGGAMGKKECRKKAEPKKKELKGFQGKRGGS